MAKFSVEGPGADALLDRVSAGAVDGDEGVITYTQWLNEGGLIEADLTVTKLAADRFLVVASDTAHGHALDWLRRAASTGTTGRRRHDHRHHRRPRPARAPGPPVARGAGRPHRHRPGHGRLPVPDRPRDRGRRRRRAVRADHLRRRARLRALRARRPRARGVRRAARRRGACPSACPRSAPCGWRRPTGTSATTSTTPTTRSRSGSASRWPSTSPAASSAGTRCWPARQPVRRRRRLVQVRLVDPEPLLFHAEPVLRDGVVVGYVRAASYGWTLGAAVGLAYVESDGAGHRGLAGRRSLAGRRRRHTARRRGVAAADVRPHVGARARVSPAPDLHSGGGAPVPPPREPLPCADHDRAAAVRSPTVRCLTQRRRISAPDAEEPQDYFGGILMPPSTRTTEPFMYGLVRHSTTMLASSSGSPSRLGNSTDSPSLALNASASSPSP